MNAYSCKPSDHRSDADMHTLMCIAILISGICSDESCIVYDTNRRPSRGNCLIWDSMPSIRAAVMIPQVSVPFLRVQEAQVWGSVFSSSENRAHHLLGPLLLVSLSWRTIRACATSIESVLYRLYILQTNVSEYGFLCQFTNAQVLQQAMVLFEDLP